MIVGHNGERCAHRVSCALVVVRHAEYGVGNGGGRVGQGLRKRGVCGTRLQGAVGASSVGAYFKVIVAACSVTVEIYVGVVAAHIYFAAGRGVPGYIRCAYGKRPGLRGNGRVVGVCKAQEPPVGGCGGHCPGIAAAV